MRRLILVTLAACSGDTSLPIDAHCNPLGATGCMTPWPSSAFAVDDPTTATGRRLAIPEHALPANVDDVDIDPTSWNAADGFSPAAPIVMSFPGGVSPIGLPSVDNMGLSLAADSPTVILDMTTGERVAHFAEVDAPAEAVVLRPAARLAPGHRYAVAITSRVVGKDGTELPVPPGFAALRDGKRTDHPLAEAMRPRFEEALEALDEAGTPLQDVVVAWEFSVASDAYLKADLDVATAAREPLHLAITSDTTVGGTRRLAGSLESPLFLSNAGEARTGTRIVRDAAGLPQLQGTYRIPFAAIVPACARAPAAMVVYGHGLFGDAGQAARAGALADELCMIVVGTNLRGLTAADLPAFEAVLGDLGRSDESFDLMVQGIVDHVTLVRAMQSSLADEIDHKRPLVARDRISYYGDGLAASVMAAAPAIERGVLAGGANYSLLVDRSSDWRPYRSALHAAYPDPLDNAIAINLLQMRWDRVETTLPLKQQLLQIAINDDHVPNVVSFWQARTLGIPVLGPSPTTPWGLVVRDSPIRAGSALVVMDGSPAAQPAAHRQIKRFLETGQIANECAGACFCAAGACE